MHGGGGEQIVHPPHGASQVRFRQNPAATEAAHAVDLGQAAGHHEVRTQEKGGSRGIFVHRIEVDLVHQYSRTHAARNLAYLAQDAFSGQDARRIVQIGDDDELCLRRNGPPHRLRFEGISTVVRTRESLDHGADGLERIYEKSIGGVLDQHFVTRIEQRGEGQVVGTRCSSCCDYAIGVDTIAGCDGPLQRRITVAVVAIDFERGQRAEFAEREGSHAAGGQIEAGATLGLRPMHVLRLFPSHLALRLRLQYQ